MPRLFRKSTLRSALSAPKYLTFEPANSKPHQQPNAPAARADAVVTSRYVLARRTSSPARCVTPGGRPLRTATSVDKVTNMGRVAARLHHKGSDGHPSRTALNVICREITTLRSGAEGIRTPDLRRAKAGHYHRRCSLVFTIACKIAPFVSGSIHVCSPLFVWVGVLLVYMSLTSTPALSHLCVVCNMLRYARRRIPR
jgi:hypothetical protein